MTQFGTSSMDGACTYVHYQIDATIAITRSFHELVGMKLIIQGYYGDEKLMIQNTVSNVDTHDFWMVKGPIRYPTIWRRLSSDPVRHSTGRSKPFVPGRGMRWFSVPGRRCRHC